MKIKIPIKLKGFEVVINNRKYFAFSYFVQNGQNVTSYCDRTFSNSSHNIGVNPINWSCYYGEKQSNLDTASSKKEHKLLEFDKFEKYLFFFINN